MFFILIMFKLSFVSFYGYAFSIRSKNRIQGHKAILLLD